jgi:RNA polymerase sigma factor (sigma-70 family)
MQVMESAVAVIDARTDIEALYRADGDRLWRAIYAFASDPDIASDAVAEAYAQLIRRGAAVRDPAAWVWRAAFRIARGALQARRFDATAASTSPGESDVSDTYADPDLLAAIRALPEGQRAAVILFYYADLPIGRIAERLGSNSLAVRANLSRGRRRLRDLLGEHDG